MPGKGVAAGTITKKVQLCWGTAQGKEIGWQAITLFSPSHCLKTWLIPHISIELHHQCATQFSPGVKQ